MSVMDTEEKIRLAIQVIVAVVLWTWGFYFIATLATIILIPWNPLYRVSEWLAEPVIKWRISKSLERVEEASRSVASQGLPELEHSDA